jgi:transposase
MTRETMNSKDIITLGLGLQAPWEIAGQLLDTDKNPHELRLTIQAQRGTRYPCPICGTLCHAHDFKEMTWRHLNFFQHHCFITAAVPRVRCQEHGVKQIEVPWARKGSKFTLLFEQAAMLLVREMPVLTTANILEMTDKRLWRIVQHYVKSAMNAIDLSGLKAFALDETKSRKGHRYITVFIDLDQTEKPVVFAVAGKGKQTLKAFKDHLVAHGGKAEQVVEVVSDMSGAFISGVKAHFTNSSHTVDWFHVVQLFTKAVDDVRRAEAKEATLPKATRWATLKNADGPLMDKQIDALAELMCMDMQTSKAWRIKEMLRWVRKASSLQGAKWRLTSFINVALALVADVDLLKPVGKALKTVAKHRDAILARWASGHSNARIEALNGIFQAAKCRARGYRNDETFISIIYLLAAPIQNLLKST